MEVVSLQQELCSHLSKIQKELKAPKGQFNHHGKFKYRSCEDILEAVKTVLPTGVSILITDEIVNIGDRFYVKATVQLYYKDQIISVSAYAREPMERKGMDASQITGATSSYARKYALNGLFCIDDTKDADTYSHQEQKPKLVESVKISDGTSSKIIDFVNAGAINEEELMVWLKKARVNDVKMLTESQGNGILRVIEKRENYKRIAI